MNTDANPFAGDEPNTTGVAEDLGGDFDLAGALEEPRELGVCLEEAIKGQHHHNSHRHRQDWG